MRLSDTIESFIKELLGASEDDGVELKRNELAEYFQCAPSQINYVLSTRFTPDHGYMIESRRGGGGCIRIVHVERNQGDYLDYLIRERVGLSLADKDAQLLLRQLVESGTVSREDGLEYSRNSFTVLSVWAMSWTLRIVAPPSRAAK